MNIRISTLLAVLLAAPVAAVANAADVPPQAATSADAPAAHGHRGGAMMRALRNLGLSDSQEAQVKSIFRDYRAKNRDTTDPEARRANMRAMRSQIEAVLTPDQQARLRDELAQMRADRRASRGGDPMATPAP